MYYYWEGKEGTVFTLLSSRHEALNKYSVMGWNLGLKANLKTAKFNLPLHKTENRGLDRPFGDLTGQDAPPPLRSS